MGENWWVIGYPIGAVLGSVIWLAILFVARRGRRGWWHR